MTLSITDEQWKLIYECFKLIGHHAYSLCAAKPGSAFPKSLTQLIHILLNNLSAIYFHQSTVGSTDWNDLSDVNRRDFFRYISSDSSLLATSSPDLIVIIGSTLESLTNKVFFNCNMPSSGHFETNFTYLEHRELIYSNNVVYALETSYSQCVLKELESEDVEGALHAFNQLFCQVTLPASYSNKMTTAKLTKLHVLLNEELNTSDHSGQPMLNNLINGLLTVESLMEACRLEHDLVLHQIWHGIDVFLDLNHLLIEKKTDLSPIHILAILCALFHDSEFTRDRVFDEIKSANHLIHFIEPILSKLSPQYRMTLVNSIHVIFTNTIPCLLDKCHEGKDNKVIIGLIALISQQYPETTSLHFLVQGAVELIALVDVHRYSIPQLHINTSTQDLGVWHDLGITGTAPRAQMSQCLRALAELGAKPDKNNIMFFAKTINRFQGNSQQEIPPLNQADISNLANAVLSEMNFSPRAGNSLDNNALGLDVAMVKRENGNHIVALRKIHRILMDKDRSLQSKQNFIFSLAYLASEQASKNAFSIDKLHVICQYIEGTVGVAPGKWCCVR